MRYLWYLRLPGDTVERGGRVHDSSALAREQAPSHQGDQVTKSRSSERWAKRLDRRIVKCWVVANSNSEDLKQIAR